MHGRPPVVVVASYVVALVVLGARPLRAASDVEVQYDFRRLGQDDPPCARDDRFGVVGRCEPLPRVPGLRIDEALWFTGKELVVFGGARVSTGGARSFLNDVAVLDVAARRWRATSGDGAPPPSDRPVVVGVGRSLFVLPRGADDLYRYRLDDDRWSKETRAGLAAADAAFVDGDVVVFAAGDRVPDPTRPALAYDVRKGAWAKVPAAPALARATIGYDAGARRWRAQRRPPWLRATNDGRRFRSFDHRFDHLLVPIDPAAADGPYVWRSAPRGVVLSGFELPLIDSFRSEPLQVIGRAGGDDLLRYGETLVRLYGAAGDERWARIASLDGQEVWKNDALEGWRPRLLWTGKELVAFGGARTHVYEAPCPVVNCPPGAACAVDVCPTETRRVVDDALVFAPEPERWRCVYRAHQQTGTLEAQFATRRQAFDVDVEVTAVAANGAAARAGLRAGDLVVALDDEAVRSGEEIDARVAEMKPGARVRLLVWRRGKTITLSASLAAGPARVFSPARCGAVASAR